MSVPLLFLLLYASPLQVTFEVPLKGVIKVLDDKFTFSDGAMCWCCSPMANKPLSFHPFQIGNKRGLVNICFINAPKKILPALQSTKGSECKPCAYVMQVIPVLHQLQKACWSKCEKQEPPIVTRKKVVTMTKRNQQFTGYSTKKMARRGNIDVSAPSKLISLCKDREETEW